MNQFEQLARLLTDDGDTHPQPKVIIGIPYAIDQNEPSKPFRLESTDDDYLKKMFFEKVLGGDVSDLSPTISITPHGYGDITVACPHEEVFLYVTIFPQLT